MICKEKMKPDEKKVEIYIDKKLCTGCGICFRVCPEGAIEMKDNKAVLIPERCKNCLICLEECPFGAIKRR